MPDDPGSAEDRWLLSPAEQALVATKNRANRLGFAILLTFFRERGRFPRDETEVEAQGIAALSEQLDAPMPVDGKAFLTGRTAERLRSEIRARFGLREATVADAEALTVWLRDHIAAEVGGELARMLEQLELHCRELAIEPPTPERMERIARSALRAHEDRFHTLKSAYCGSSSLRKAWIFARNSPRASSRGSIPCCASNAWVFHSRNALIATRWSLI